MQPVELDVGGNLDPTQNLWLHMVERDFEAGDGGGHVANLRHSRSLAQGNVRHREQQAKQSCVREDVLSAGCESRHAEPYRVKRKVTASSTSEEAGLAPPRAETGWRATGSECVARRITNPFRRDGAASLRLEGEALRDAQAEMAVKAMSVPIEWLGAGCAEGKTE